MERIETDVVGRKDKPIARPVGDIGQTLPLRQVNRLFQSAVHPRITLYADDPVFVLEHRKGLLFQ